MSKIHLFFMFYSICLSVVSRWLPFICLFLFLLCAGEFYAQAQNGPVHSNFSLKTTANGLGSNVVYSVYAVGSSPTSTTVYAATGGGLSISTDGGNTFTNKTTSNGLGSNDVRFLFVTGSPGSTTIYAGADGGGLNISTDGGNTFIRKTTSNGLGGNSAYGIYAQGTSPASTTVYVATNNGVSISTDGGNSFINKTTSNGLGANLIYSLYGQGTSPASTTVYAGGFFSGGLNISTNGGNSFTSRTNGNSGLGSDAVSGVYAVGNTIYVATWGGLSISTDGGNTFVNKTTSNGLGNTIVDGVYAVGNTVYAGTRTNGLSISTDGGNTFTIYTNNIGTSARVSGIYTVDNTIYAATSVGLAISSPTITIATSVSPTTVCAGNTFALSVTATGGASPYSYTFSTPPGIVLSTTATSNSVVSGTATVGLSGMQTLTVTVGDSGGLPINTSLVSLTVDPGPTVSIAGNTTICAGGSTTLTASGGISYLWSPGGTSTSAISVSVAGIYSATATSGGCSGTASANVTVQDALSITTQPAAQSAVCAGGTATASVSTSSIGSLTYQWYKGATRVASQTTATLSLTNVTVSDAGNYSVVVTGDCNSATSTVFSLTVNTPPSNSSLTATALSCIANATLTASATGATSFTLSDGQSNNTGRFVVSSAGMYTVISSNSSGCLATATTSVTVDNSVPSISLVSQPAAASTVCEGGAVQVFVGVSGTATGGYQWYQNSMAVGGQTSATLTLSNSQQGQAGSYVLVVTSACNSLTTNPFVLTVQPLPTVTIYVPTGTTIEGAGVPTITLPPGNVQMVQATGGSQYNWSVVLDRINGYEVRATETNTNGFFPARFRGTFRLSVAGSGGCVRTVEGIIR